MYLIVGLGNPGLKYKNMRHNIGFQVVEILSARWRIGLNQQSCSSRWGRGDWHGNKVLLAQPDTYMNLSGRAVFRLMAYCNASAADLMIVHDDLDLPLGRIKFVAKGGAGGHRGISSIINTLHTTDFLRLKIGIGRPQYGETVEQYVLSLFYPSERDLVMTMAERAADALETVLLSGLNQAMSYFHNQIPRADTPNNLRD